MKRRKFLTVGGAGIVGTAGCLGGGGSELPDSLQWSTNTEGDADATVNDHDEIDLRVFRCSTAAVRSDLGELSGTLEVSFDYTVEAEGWYEIPTWTVLEDDDPVDQSNEDNGNTIQKEEYETTSGTIQTDVPVDGNSTIVFRIDPSNHCNNPDHGNTHFEVRNLSLNLS